MPKQTFRSCCIRNQIFLTQDVYTAANGQMKHLCDVYTPMFAMVFGFLSPILPVFSVYCCTTEVQSKYIWRVRILVSFQTVAHYRRHVTATRRGDRSLLLVRQQVARPVAAKKLFRVYWSVCLPNRILSPQRFAQIQIHLILRYL